MAGAFTSTITKVSVTLLSLDARPHHFAFKRSGTAASGADGFDEMYAAANGFWPHVASHMEVDRLDPFEKIECVGKLNSRRFGERWFFRWTGSFRRSRFDALIKVPVRI